MDPLLNDLDFKFDPNDIDDSDDDEVAFALETTLGNGGGIFNTDNLNPYSYGYNDPVRFEDPDGRCPICIYVVAALLYSEFANSPTGNAKNDNRNYNSSKENKTRASAAVLNGTKGLIDSAKSTAVESITDKANEKLSDKKVPNPYGAKGKPDHQEKVKELEKKAKQEHPNDDVVTEKKIKAEGSNRKPDVQVVDKETGKTKKIYEAERRPNSKRNVAREAEYKKLNIPNETHKVGK